MSTTDASDGTAGDRRSGETADESAADESPGTRAQERGRVEKAARTRAWNAADRDVWEVFRRPDDGGRVHRVGRVRAEDAEEAHAVASRLYAWYAPEVWVCPAATITRFTEDGDTEEDDSEVRCDEPRTVEF